MKLQNTFQSFKGFESSFRVYKYIYFVDYFIKNCMTFVSINVKFPNGRMVTTSNNLKYYYIKFCCVHGGSYKKKIYT